MLLLLLLTHKRRDRFKKNEKSRENELFVSFIHSFNLHGIMQQGWGMDNLAAFCETNLFFFFHALVQRTLLGPQ